MKYVLISFLFFATLITNEVYAQIPAGYYDGTSGLTGEQLKSKLHSIIRNHTVKTYSEVKDVLRDVDEDPINSSNVILIYTRRSISKSNFASNNEPDFWNREHTWPKSHGFPSEQDTAYTDTHALRPCDATVNSSRSNKDFNNVENIASNEQGEAADTYTTDDFWEPTDEVKGDLARTMFYMATRYNSESLDLELVDRISRSGDPELGVLYTLLQWHENDPVNQAEIDRNDGIYGYQGNRNPFIDNSSWVADIWGISTDPLFSINQEAFNTNFGTVAAGNTLVQQYTLKAYNLTNDVEVVVNSPFSISLDNSNWNQALTILKGNTSPLETVIYIQFSPVVEDGSTYESTVTHSSTGATNALFTVSGTEGSIQQITLAEARQKPLDDVVSVSGVVISKGNNSSNSRVIFDGTAGIVVRSFDAGNESAPLNYGDSIIVSGGLSEYNNLLQIENSPIVITLIKENAIIPEPQLITINQVNENYESELITIENVEFIESGVFAGGGSAGNFTISDGVNSMVLRIGSSSHPLVGTEIPSGKLTFTGIIGQYQSNYQLMPRDANDMVLDENPVLGLGKTNLSFNIYPNPTKNVVHFAGLSRSLLTYNISITNQLGKKVENGFIVQSDYIELNGLKSGIYILHIIGENGNSTIKIIKR